MKLRPEEIIQAQCVDFTRVMCPQVLLVASMNGMYLGGGKNVRAYIHKMLKLGMRPGDLDLRLHWRGLAGDGADCSEAPMTAYIELKAGKNPLTDQEIDFMAELSRIGILRDWTNSFEGYVDILKKWQVPMRSGLYAGIGYIRPQWLEVRKP